MNNLLLFLWGVACILLAVMGWLLMHGAVEELERVRDIIRDRGYRWTYVCDASSAVAIFFIGFVLYVPLFSFVMEVMG